jgi:hypothetical protein
MIKYLLPLAAGLALLSCKKDGPEPGPTPKPDLTAEYFFTNQGDANLETLGLESRTFWPNVCGTGCNTMHLFGKMYYNVTPTQRIRHVSDELGRRDLAPGCLTQFEVRLVFRNPVYTPYTTAQPPASGYKVRLFVLPVDTIKDPTKGKYTFNWPADTLKYPEKRWYY